MLKTKNNTIIDSKSREVLLHGVNLGAWLMMEGYFLYGRNIPERSFKAEMERRYGNKGLDSFTNSYRNNFIQEQDFKNIHDLGFNCIRLPFNYRLIEDEDRPFKYKEKGVHFLEKALGLCSKYNIYCILDMHAGCGSQNQDWHGDSDGKAELWTSKKNQERFFRLWEFLADRFKDNKMIAGYDLLNEPVIKQAEPKKILRNFYIQAVNRIRQIDKNHIIFLEGNFWAQLLEHIGEPFTDNLSYGIHYYHPLDFTFNFHKGLRYPGNIEGENWGINRIKKDLEVYYNYSRKWKIPVFVGEFGVNYRCGKCYGELVWVRDVLKCFNEYKFHWTYWTYKAVANSIFPDGIYQYLENPAWVNRQGHVYGWENFYTLWKRHEKEIIESWKTRNFTRQDDIANLLCRISKSKSRPSNNYTL